jgi:ankyrin repeat protein
VKLNALESVDLLLKKGADPNIRNYKGDTPFSIAITLGYEQILNGLLRAGAGEKVR